MGVFGAFFGCIGVVGFNGCCSGASIGDGGFTLACISGCRGVVGFTVTTSVRPVREKVRPAWLDVCVSAKKFAQRTKNGPQSAFSGVLGEVFRGNALGGLCWASFFADRQSWAWPPAPLLAVLTLQCAATPYGWHVGQPAQATTHRANVRWMRLQRWGLESSQAPGAFHISRETTEAGSRRIPPLVACGGRAVNTEKSAPKSQRQKLSARASARQQWPQ